MEWHFFSVDVHLDGGAKHPHITLGLSSNAGHEGLPFALCTLAVGFGKAKGVEPPKGVIDLSTLKMGVTA